MTTQVFMTVRLQKAELNGTKVRSCPRMESSRIFWRTLQCNFSVHHMPVRGWSRVAKKKMVENKPSLLYRMLQHRTSVHLCKSSISRPDCFFPSSFSSRAANNISHPPHVATKQIRADKTWNCCFDCGSTAPHFPAHSLLQQWGREVQPASVFRFVDPVIESASLFFILLSSVWEAKQQKGQKRGSHPGYLWAHLSIPARYYSGADGCSIFLVSRLMGEQNIEWGYVENMRFSPLKMNIISVFRGQRCFSLCWNYSQNSEKNRWNTAILFYYLLTFDGGIEKLWVTFGPQAACSCLLYVYLFYMI